jgi:hypothetical protein
LIISTIMVILVVVPSSVDGMCFSFTSLFYVVLYIKHQSRH